MKKLRIFFDYIYFRVSKFFYKSDGANGDRAMYAISMTQALLIIEIPLIISGIVNTREETAPYAKIISIFGCCVFICICIYNYFYYKNRYGFFETYWGKETKQQSRKRGILVVLALIIPWVILFIASALNR